MDLNGTFFGNASIERVSQEAVERVYVVEEHIFFAMKCPRKPQQAVTNFPAGEKKDNGTIQNN